jgi:hypothetical protein
MRNYEFLFNPSIDDMKFLGTQTIGASNERFIYKDENLFYGRVACYQPIERVLQRNLHPGGKCHSSMGTHLEDHTGCCMVC